MAKPVRARMVKENNKHKTGHDAAADDKSAVNEKETQAEMLLNLAEDIDLFHTPEDECFGTFEVGEHFETHRLDTNLFKNYLVRLFYNEHHRPPSKQALQDALLQLEAQARFDGSRRVVHLRVAAEGEAIFIDLCDEEWRVVRVTAEKWSVIDAKDSPVRFRRNKRSTPLPEPAEGGTIEDLRPFLNLGEGEEGEDAFILIAGWLVSCFRPDYPFAILAFSGEPGTAKSTNSRFLKRSVDPGVGQLQSIPRNEQDLMIAAKNNWVIAIDNISHIPDWLSDALCRLATGGGISNRRLYENDEECFLAAKRPVILNGIGHYAVRSDLVDRIVSVKPGVIPPARRIPEEELKRDFEEKGGLIMGAILSGVSSALKNIEQVTLERLPRMADFARWATAAEEGLGFEKGAFMRAYWRNREEAHGIVLESSLLAEVLQEYCGGSQAAFDETMLLKELLSKLTELAGARAENRPGARSPFPKSPRGLRSELQRIAPNLREVGIDVTMLGKAPGSKHLGASVRVEYRPVLTPETSGTSAGCGSKADEVDGASLLDGLACESDNDAIQAFRPDDADGPDGLHHGEERELQNDKSALKARLSKLLKEPRQYNLCPNCGKHKYTDYPCPYCGPDAPSECETGR